MTIPCMYYQAEMSECLRPGIVRLLSPPLAICAHHWYRLILRKAQEGAE